ncbi:hypothetical protein P879_11799 [Paragonimus westermani]|uniref:SBF1/SBF2 domain-containing protein n=1 Tax=Paragonimus westermani TaxID=34504 RepID=A0A8T0D2B7_9TREM|nr:hypothetical protein P879_11799 [Paragonimus westermani]
MQSVRTEGLIATDGLPVLLEKIGYLLNECQDAEDFAPARKLLTSSLLYYVEDPSRSTERTSLFSYIKPEPIWHTLRFWNACFFQSVQEARAKLAEKNQ